MFVKMTSMVKKKMIEAEIVLPLFVKIMANNAATEANAAEYSMANSIVLKTSNATDWSSIAPNLDNRVLITILKTGNSRERRITPQEYTQFCRKTFHSAIPARCHVLHDPA